LQVASLSEQFNANPSEDEINPPFWVIFSRKVGSVVAWGGHENHARRQLLMELIDRSSGGKRFLMAADLVAFSGRSPSVVDFRLRLQRAKRRAKIVCGGPSRGILKHTLTGMA
jgi:hypothetical protein